MHRDPALETNPDATAGGDALDEFLRRAPATMVSIIVHLLVLICLALFSLSVNEDAPLVIEIGQAAEQRGPLIESITIEAPEIDPEPIVSQISPLAIEMASQPIELPVNAVTPEVDLGRLAAGSMKGYSPSFARRITDARQNGIEIVIVFDSTGSMGPEITAVKQRIRQISESVLSKIPRAQFSLVTYRDVSDAYVVRGVPLSQDIKRMQRFVDGVDAKGGGDHPEAVQVGMRWALYENRFRSDAQKVMLLFGDAPPHRTDLDACLEMAETFRAYGKGRVFTVTCRKPVVIPEFYAIARAGDGEAYLLGNTQRLMEDLLVIAFGADQREQVLRFFEIQRATPQHRGTRARGRRRR